MEISNSKFMADCTKNDKGKEAIMSFEVSWILRVAADKTEQKARPILYRKCNEILFKLLGICESNDIIIKEIKVWKEWDNIDVLANVIITVNGKEERHVIVIENKIYTKMKVNQRDDYPKKNKKRIQFL